MDYDSSNLQNIQKDSDFSYGISIPASKFIDINLFKHRGIDLGFSVSYKANYSKDIIPKHEIIPSLNFNEKDLILLSENNQVFTGTLNTLLKSFGIFTQEIYLENGTLELVIDQANYRNLNTASKRVIQLSRDVLKTREINDINLIYKTGNVKTLSYSFPLEKFLDYLDNLSSIPELDRFIEIKNF